MSEHRIALVTGASRGIGRAIALELANEGFDIGINYNGSETAAQELAAKIEKTGARAICLKCNVSDGKACEEMFKRLAEELGAPSVLVNNAGITRDGLMVSMSDEDFEAVLDTNLKGSFNCMKLASKYMIKQRYGRIVNISSVSGIMGNAGQTNYSAAKAGIIGLTKAAARELAGRDITVNAVAPGFVVSDMTDALSDKVKEAVTAQIPKKRFGRPEEIAKAVAFLCRESSAYITGQVLCVDGGMSM